MYDINKNKTKQLVKVKELTMPVLKKLDELKDPAFRSGIPTGYVGIDNILNGLHPSDLILLAARPGVGKTALAMNIMSNIALNVNRKITNGQKPKLHCAVFSLEMSKEQLMQRLICSVGEVSMTNASKALRGRMDKGFLRPSFWTNANYILTIPLTYAPKIF